MYVSQEGIMFPSPPHYYEYVIDGFVGYLTTLYQLFYELWNNYILCSSEYENLEGSSRYLLEDALENVSEN
jgi:hypothetical protein